MSPGSRRAGQLAADLKNNTQCRGTELAESDFVRELGREANEDLVASE